MSLVQLFSHFKIPNKALLYYVSLIFVFFWNKTNLFCTWLFCSTDKVQIGLVFVTWLTLFVSIIPDFPCVWPAWTGPLANPIWSNWSVQLSPVSTASACANRKLRLIRYIALFNDTFSLLKWGGKTSFKNVIFCS